MIWFTLLIPIFTVIILFIFFRKKVHIWEYAVVIIPSALLILLLNFIMISSNVQDTEFLGYSVDGVRDVEHWDEWITKTCSYTTSHRVGKVTVTKVHYYDCSYRKDHPQYYALVYNGNIEVQINRSYYEYLLKKFNSQSYRVDMHRDYYRIDGDMYETKWSGTINTAHSVNTSENYENKIQASHSVFKIEDLEELEIKKWKLYDYPSIENYNQDAILGYNQNEIEQNKIHYLNGYLSKKHQIKTFILIFKNQSQTAAYKQRSHWEGFNKNEFVICIGIDSTTNEINWSKSFSWMDVPTLATDVDSYVMSQKKLNVNNLLDQLIQKTPVEWKRKNFHDFDYLEIEVTDTQLTWIIIITIIINVLISIWVITNEFDNEPFTYKYKGRF